MVATTIKVTGAKELLGTLSKYRTAAPDAANAAKYQRALQIVAAADTLVPVETGRLRASHFVEPPDENGRVRFGYGTNYALAVHERVYVHHEHGQAKFLELAWDEAKPDNARWIAAKTIENIKNGVGLRLGSMPKSAAEGAAAAEAYVQKRARARAKSARKRMFKRVVRFFGGR